jgi:hypothetical protein
VCASVVAAGLGGELLSEAAGPLSFVKRLWRDRSEPERAASTVERRPSLLSGQGFFGRDRDPRQSDRPAPTQKIERSGLDQDPFLIRPSARQIASTAPANGSEAPVTSAETRLAGISAPRSIQGQTAPPKAVRSVSSDADGSQAARLPESFASTPPTERRAATPTSDLPRQPKQDRQSTGTAAGTEFAPEFDAAFQHLLRSVKTQPAVTTRFEASPVSPVLPVSPETRSNVDTDSLKFDAPPIQGLTADLAPRLAQVETATDTSPGRPSETVAAPLLPGFLDTSAQKTQSIPPAANSAGRLVMGETPLGVVASQEGRSAIEPEVAVGVPEIHPATPRERFEAPHWTTPEEVTTADSADEVFDQLISRSRREMAESPLARRELTIDGSVESRPSPADSIMSTADGPDRGLALTRGFDSGDSLQPLRGPVSPDLIMPTDQVPDRAELRRGSVDRAGRPAVGILIRPGASGSGVHVKSRDEDSFGQRRPRVISNAPAEVSVPERASVESEASRFQRLSFDNASAESVVDARAQIATDRENPTAVRESSKQTADAGAREPLFLVPQFGVASSDQQSDLHEAHADGSHNIDVPADDEDSVSAASVSVAPKTGRQIIVDEEELKPREASGVGSNWWSWAVCLLLFGAGGALLIRRKAPVDTAGTIGSRVTAEKG